MEAFLVSTLAITIGEIGDKTQLLALLLAAKFRKPIPIIFGIFCATLLNHFTAAAIGEWVSLHIDKTVLHWVLAASFLVIAVWTLKADNLDGEDAKFGSYGAFATTLVTFFLAEIGDKTQIATVMLAMKYQNLVLVVAGTTLGMLLADIPAVFLGHHASRKIPMKLFRYTAAVIFVVMAIGIIINMDN